VDGNSVGLGWHVREQARAEASTKIDKTERAYNFQTQKSSHFFNEPTPNLHQSTQHLVEITLLLSRANNINTQESKETQYIHTPTHTPMTQESKEWAGFEHYITREDKQRKQEEGRKERIAIETSDTKHTLKRKRNNGCCEFEGCEATEHLEWHHEPSFYSKHLPQQSGVGGCVCEGGGGDGGVYRKISDFKPTTNPNVINAYEQQMQKCSLLCKNHHETTHTHTHLENCRLQQQHTIVKRLAMYSAIQSEHGHMAAVCVLRAFRKLN
jgi:hypothetical protein